MQTHLVSPSELHAQLNSAVIVDCRFDLGDVDAGRTAYLAGHIPGALYAHLDADLSGPKSSSRGRHPLPDPAVLATTFGRLGISAKTTVIAYDADNGMFASRLWWLLRWLGHRQVAVLEGGYKAWKNAALPISTDVPTARVQAFIGSPQANLLVSAEEVAQRVKQSDWRVLDARAPERFRGDVEPIDSVAGHVPGAQNHPFAWNLGSDGRFLPDEQLAKRFATSLGDVSADHTIMMCGSGVTACHNLLAMEVAGLSGAKLYAGSWSEWIRDPSRPIAKGAA